MKYTWFFSKRKQNEDTKDLFKIVSDDYFFDMNVWKYHPFLWLQSPPSSACRQKSKALLPNDLHLTI